MASAINPMLSTTLVSSILCAAPESARLVLWGAREGDVQLGETEDLMRELQRDHAEARRRMIEQFGRTFAEMNRQISTAMEAIVIGGREFLETLREAGLDG